jgi:hypothetical protein
MKVVNGSFGRYVYGVACNIRIIPSRFLLRYDKIDL